MCSTPLMLFFMLLGAALASVVWNHFHTNLKARYAKAMKVKSTQVRQQMRHIKTLERELDH